MAFSHVHDVGSKPLACQFETGLRAGRILEEHVDLGQAAQCGVVFYLTAIEIDVTLGQIQKCRDFVGGQMVNPQKMARAKAHERLPLISRCIDRGR